MFPKHYNSITESSRVIKETKFCAVKIGKFYAI